MKSELFKVDIEKTLKILERAFELTNKPEKKGDGVKVSLIRLDLERENAQTSIENLSEVLHHLKKTGDLAGMEILYIYDFVNGPDGSDHENPDPYPSLVDLILPVNFMEISEKLRKQYFANGSKKAKKISSSVVESIICVKPEMNGQEFEVVVNGDYKEAFTCNRKIDSWDVLYEVADKGQYDIPDEEKEKVKNTVDYFNTSKANKIYTNTKLNITRVLRIEDNRVLPVVSVSIKTMSQKEYGKNKLPKST